MLKNDTLYIDTQASGVCKPRQYTIDEINDYGYCYRNIVADDIMRRYDRSSLKELVPVGQFLTWRLMGYWKRVVRYIPSVLKILQTVIIAVGIALSFTLLATLIMMLLEA